jgi:hypothetical protein
MSQLTLSCQFKSAIKQHKTSVTSWLCLVWKELASCSSILSTLRWSYTKHSIQPQSTHNTLTATNITKFTSNKPNSYTLGLPYSRPGLPNTNKLVHQSRPWLGHQSYLNGDGLIKRFKHTIWSLVSRMVWIIRDGWAVLWCRCQIADTSGFNSFETRRYEQTT